MDVHHSVDLQSPIMDDLDTNTLFELPKEYVSLVFADALPFLIPSFGVAQLEVSEYLITKSFHLQLHTIIVSKDVLRPLGSTTNSIYVSAIYENNIGHK